MCSRPPCARGHAQGGQAKLCETTAGEGLQCELAWVTTNAFRDEESQKLCSRALWRRAMKHCRAPVMLTRHDLSVRARLAQRKARSIWPGQVSGGHIRPSRFDESFADIARNCRRRDPAAAAGRETPRPVDPGGACCGPVHSPFCLRLRDQIRLKVSPSSTRLAYIGTVKLGSSSLTDR